MLTINPVRSSADAKRYYAVSDYYSEGQSQETVGRWGGRLAEMLGLRGTVDKERFDKLCDNINPLTDERLTPRTRANRRVAYDLTFSTPKSFSILEALAPEEERERLFAAFDGAVHDTMREVESDMACRVRVGGQDADRVTGNMVWAEYDHSTSRPVGANAPDMHRHKHVVAFSATYDPVENRIKAGQFGGIKRDGEYYAAAFYSRLAVRLGGMGYGIARSGGKEWEIAGVPGSVISKFSKRTDQVERAAEKLGITGGAAKAELGAKTRGKKQKELTQDELRVAWDKQLTDAERQALAAVVAGDGGSHREVTPGQAVAFAIEHLSERRSVFAEREVKAAAMLYGLGSVTPDSAQAELTAPGHGLIVRDMDGRRMATTKALQNEEDAIIRLAAGGRGSVRPIGVPEGLTPVLADGKRLSDEQFAVVTGLLTSRDRVSLVLGPAGAGKSWSLQKYDEAMRAKGETVTYLATTTAATSVLAKEGFQAATVQRFLVDDKMQQAAAGGRVIIDESSMLGHKDAVRLYALAGKLNLKLIHIGDPFQHGSVPRGALLHILEDYASIKPHRLTEILRQQPPDYRAAVKLLSRGETLKGFDALDKMGWVREVEDDDARVQAIAGDYLQATQDKATCLVVSPTHREAAAITGAIREGLRAAGKLGEADRELTRLAPVDATEAERREASTYREGDVLVFHQNAKGGFRRGERLVVKEVESLPLSEAARFSLYRPETMALAEGDALRFTGTVKTRDGKHELKNGQVRTLAGFTERGDLRLDNGWVVSRKAGLLNHGYVVTSFGAQGRTSDRVILGMASESAPAMNQEQMYVSASRGKQRVTLYTDDKAEVRDAIAKSSKKLAAIDLRRKRPQVIPLDRKAGHAARRRRIDYYETLRSLYERAARRLVPRQERQQTHGR